MHTVLTRQLKRCNLSEEDCPTDLNQWREFLVRINRVYTDLDQERYLSQRAQEVSSREMQELYNHLIFTEKFASIGQLAAGMAHEINNPLSYVISNLNILEARLSTVEQLVKLNQQLLLTMKTAEKSQLQSICDQISKLIEEQKLVAIFADIAPLLAESKEGLLRINKIVQALKVYSGASKEKMQPVDINACLEAAVELAWNTLKYQCVLNKKLGDLPKIMGLPAQLEIVFTNLIKNAVESIVEKGEITIISQLKDTEILVSIADNGSGIALENLQKLFTPFFTTKSSNHATGLGLAMSQAIIRLHGGVIKVTSKVGMGSTFTIHLPLHPVLDTPVERQS